MLQIGSAQTGRGNTPRLAPRRRLALPCAPCYTLKSNCGHRFQFTARGTCIPQAVQDGTTTPATGNTDTSLEEFPRGQWSLHKFGGTCVSAAERIEQAGDILVKAKVPMNMQFSGKKAFAITSAMGSHPSSPVKVTDLILNMIEKAAQKDDAFLLDLAALQEKHIVTAKELLGDGTKQGKAELTSFTARLLNDISNLKSMLQAISIAGLTTDAFSDFVVGHGELWCARMFAASMRLKGHNCEMLDARDVLVVEPTSDGQSVDVDYEASEANLDKWARKHGDVDIIIGTGFIARDTNKQVTTLRRNGSDYSATIFGALTRSEEICIWTDVNGVFSADPRKVPEAVCLDSLAYHEAWELSYFGANVLHPRTTLPAMRYGIPVVIRNFFDLSAAGTRITHLSEQPDADSALPVSGFATIENVSLINVEGTGMQGVPGTASSIFSTLRDNNINVIMISQASSEHSVCFAIKDSEGERARAVLAYKFADAIRAGRIQNVDVEKNCAVLAAVGQRMAANRGVAAKFFDALATAGVNIKAMAQGSSEYNITVMVNQADITKALRAVHARFFMSATTVNLALVGPGLVGGALLDQLQSQCCKLEQQYKLDVRVMAIATSSKVLMKPTGIDLSNWRQLFADEAKEGTLDDVASHLVGSALPNSVIVDCTASDVPAMQYEKWMKQGIHVVTPNKKLGSGPFQQYAAVRKLTRRTYTHWYYEATVGAGLPIIATLKHLRETGDRIISVEGIFSGTLSYLFNSFGKDDRPFSQIVQQAKEAGFTEPDPRDDLSGMDVARKVVILAREAGLELELDDVPVTSLVPAELEAGTSTEFLEKLAQFDDDIASKAKAAADKGEILRYVGAVDCINNTGSVELRSYPADHAFCQLNGTDNIIAFRTERYNEQPLIVRGPGAGAEVTAAGVFSDLLRLSSHMGAPL